MSKRKNTKPLKKIFLNNIKLVSIFTVVVLVLFPAILCGILKYSTENIPGNAFVITDKMNAWFSFFASYSGVLVSSAIGIITLYLTVVLDDYNSKSLEQQNRLSIATNMPNMVCESMRLYALGEGDRPYMQLRKFFKENNHILTFKMNPAFPPYFEIRILSMNVKLKNPVSGLSTEDCVAILDSENYRITNNDKLEVVISIPEKLEDRMQDLYFMSLLTSEGTKYERNIVDLWIEFSCSNVLLEAEQGNVKFNLHFEVENSGKKESNGVELRIINRQFERIE